MFSVLLWYVRLYSLEHIGQRIVNWQRVFRNMGSIPFGCFDWTGNSGSLAGGCSILAAAGVDTARPTGGGGGGTPLKAGCTGIDMLDPRLWWWRSSRA